MINYILKRLLGMIPVLLGVTVLSFAIIQLAPGKFSALDQAMNPKVLRNISSAWLKFLISINLCLSSIALAEEFSPFQLRPVLER